MKAIKKLMLAGFSVALASGPLRADSPDPSAQLRETLRSTMIQLRDAQSQLASAQAQAAADADQKKALSDQIAALTKRVQEDQASSSKDADALKAKLAEAQAGADRLGRLLSEWKAAAEKAAAASRAAAAQRDKEAAEKVALERKVEDITARNAELFRLGSEILDRYEKFSLGTQFLAREPFVGRTRVELESQIEDYGDQLSEERAPE